jgi:uncharacterized protein YkwD
MVFTLGRTGRPALLVLLLVALLAVSAAPASASTESVAQSGLLSLINGARADLGLRALRSDPKLGSLAVNRARFMVRTGELSHTTFGGAIGDAVDTTGITWLSVGEDVAMAGSATGASTASVLFNIWKNSPPHWAAITGRVFNYIGIGVALTPAGAPFAALVFVETGDRTAPAVSMTGGSRSGSRVTWTWKGSDVLLQTHTAGFCSFDVAYRVDSGAWKTIRSRTTGRSLVLASRPAAHVYAVRVRGRDCAGNVSTWSSAKAVRVP